MALTKGLHKGDARKIRLLDREIDYRVLHSKSARKLRIRVTSDGVSVILPVMRDEGEARSFLQGNGEWVNEQIDRIERMKSIRTPERLGQGELLLRGEKLPIKVICDKAWRGSNKVKLHASNIVIVRGPGSRTPVATSLENWLRKQARESIESHITDLSSRVKRTPRGLYIMGQRTKWGNCSALGNLSFNWRLIMAPEFVLRYIVTHEIVHLIIPDHSQKFWLTVQSLCPSAEKARQWLVANTKNLSWDLPGLF